MPLLDAVRVTDPGFDLAYHVRRIRVLSPGTLRDVVYLVEGSLMTPLDTNRLLWEFTHVEGVKGGRAALIARMSHAVTDSSAGNCTIGINCDPATGTHPHLFQTCLEEASTR